MENDQVLTPTQRATKLLQLMPRRDRAIERRLPYVSDLGGYLITRQTRRYWSVSGTPMKLDKAAECIGKAIA